MRRRRRLPPGIALAGALLSALAAGCGGQRDAAADAPVAPEAASTPAVRMLGLAELEVAVKNNLQRGALVSFWATW